MHFVSFIFVLNWIFYIFSVGFANLACKMGCCAGLWNQIRFCMKSFFTDSVKRLGLGWQVGTKKSTFYDDIVVKFMTRFTLTFIDIQQRKDSKKLSLSQKETNLKQEDIWYCCKRCISELNRNQAFLIICYFYAHLDGKKLSWFLAFSILEVLIQKILQKRSSTGKSGSQRIK